MNRYRAGGLFNWARSHVAELQLTKREFGVYTRQIDENFET